jgi:hypothetical protein
MPASSPVPALDYYRDPIDLQIRIYADGSRYTADILAFGRAVRVPIELSVHDLAGINRQLQETIADLTQQYAYIAPEEKIEWLGELAKVGYWAYRRVFNAEAAEILSTVLENKRNSVIQVTTEDFFLPWELIHPRNLQEPLSFDHFWGFQHIISRVVVQDTRPGAFVSPTIMVKDVPDIGLLTDDLPAVDSIETPFFKNLEVEQRIQLHHLRRLSAEPYRKRAEMQEFVRFWRTRYAVAHLACHASYRADLPDMSSISLAQDFVITLMDMNSEDLTLSGYPLVILNACDTGNLNPLYTGHFAGSFLRFGARGVVATECPVPDAFAAEFAQILFEHLLVGRPLGESMFLARRHFLENRDDPSGLLYSMYAPPSIRLAKQS